MPAVSVVLPVFNGAEFLRTSISSILGQSFRDLELIVIDDCSDDDSSAIVESFSDGRIVRLRNDVNVGLAASLNSGMALAHGELIARQDQDDIAHPDRLFRQISFLSEHPNIGLVGTWAAILSQVGDGRWGITSHHRHPTDDPTLRWRLLWNSPFVHSSVVMRRAVVQELGGYATDPALALPEDYDLWVRMSRVVNLANIPSVLQCYRETPGGLSRQRADAIAAGVQRISRLNLAESTKRSADDPYVADLALTLNGFPPTQGGLRPWLNRARLLQEAAEAIHGFHGPRALGELLYAEARTAARSSRSLRAPTYVKHRSAVATSPPHDVTGGSTPSP